MGDVNQKLYLRKFLPTTTGPVLEVGSKNYGNTASFREEFAGSEYIGIDMEAGENVDCVLDLSKGTGELPHRHFALAICCSVLEHVARPWEFAPRLSSLIAPGGALYMSVPWVWRYHAYPDDYFRFSWRGIIELFPEFEWHDIYYSSTHQGDFFPISDASNDADNRLAVVVNQDETSRKYLPYLMVNMLGTKRLAGERAA